MPCLAEIPERPIGFLKRNRGRVDLEERGSGSGGRGNCGLNVLKKIK